jgi:thioredoxin reductase (NADPH)
MKEKYDVIIIGSGIAGMTAGIYLKRGGLNPLIIEENVPGGQLNKINTIENYPGFKNIDGPSLAAEIFAQTRNLDIDYLFDKVIKVELDGEEKKIITSNKVLTCHYLVIATGRLSKKLFNDDEKYIGSGISYCGICDGHLYKGKNVIVVGGANAAMEEALYLSNICENITMIIRGEQLRGDAKLIKEVKKQNNIKCLYNSNVKEYNIENRKLASVELDNGELINADGLFVSIGSIPSADMFDVAKEKGFIVVDSECMTNINNVYACGDVIKKNVYQLTTAASEGTMVAYSIIRKSKK